MSILIISDLSFLVLFTLGVVLFLYANRKNIHREGIMYLYKTQLGVKLIDIIGKKFGKTIRSLHYTVIALGYLLFAGMMFIIGQTIYIYLAIPQITETIKTPPLLPLIPYFPQLFGAESLFPPFYFIYFLLALIVVAFSHEFSHGIFARANNVRIKSTGVAFLGPILGAFVEQDDKQMTKKDKVPQMAILGAGVFANTIMAIIFFLLLVLTFNTMFQPSGVIFSSYSYGIVNMSQVTNITNNTDGVMYIQTTTQKYITDNSTFNKQMSSNEQLIIAFLDAPAVRNNISGAIKEINGIKTTSFESFLEEFSKYKPSDTVTIKTTVGQYEIVLDKHPLNNSNPFLGVGFRNTDNQKIISKIFSFKKANVYYEAKFMGANFTYNLFWWIAIINIMVGMFNMLPFGFLDGGRFFYLTVLGITKSEKKAEKAFKIATKIILGLFIILMLVWLLAFKIR
ncbi:MAG: site-2 protease family protein [Nanoarchaeota archaeon]